MAEPLGAEAARPEEPLASLGRPDGILTASQCAPDDSVLPLQARAAHGWIWETGEVAASYLYSQLTPNLEAGLPRSTHRLLTSWRKLLKGSYKRHTALLAGPGVARFTHSIGRKVLQYGGDGSPS